MTEVFSGSQGGPPRSSFDRVIAAVNAAGLRHKVTNGGTHVQAECPTHADQAPSLSIDWLPDGKTGLKCQAGCSNDDVLAALDLNYPMLFDDYEDPDSFKERRAREREEERKSGRRRSVSRAKQAPVAKRRPALPKGRLPARVTKVEPQPLGEWSVTTTYDYCDVDGLVIHQEVRHQRPIEVVNTETGEVTQKVEKRFTQRWPDDKGGWVEKTPTGFVPVLYRLPDLADWVAEGRPVWLCEGAKDAERFLELGEAATTNPSGAGNFKPEQATTLAGAHVVVVLDHDLAGYRRGLKLAELLVDVASLRLVLPVVAGRHEDASDHFDAGHGLEDFVDVTLEELRLLEQVAEAEESVLLGREAAAETRARAQRVQGGTSARAAEDARFARRWAAETGKQLVRAVTALETAIQLGDVGGGYQARLIAAVAAAQTSAREAHSVARVEIPAELEAYLQAPEFPSGHTVAGDLNNVIELPTADHRPVPGKRLVTTDRNWWAYEVGGPGRRDRGVYMTNRSDDSPWQWVAPLPYVHARVIQRDGSGKPTGMFYLVSRDPDSEVVTIGWEEIRSNSWSNILGVAIFNDDKIRAAATSALEDLAQTAEVREATPRMADDGKISLPFEMPVGYLTSSDLPREQALARWREIATLAAENPQFALVLGASAVAPFIASIPGQQPHVVSMYGKAKAGKTTSLTTASAMWGYPGGETKAGVRLSWNATSLSVPAFLGSLACLPAFFDEIGQAGDMKDSQWHQLISNITQGAVRMTRASRGKPGVQLGLTWRGIFFSTGNGTMGTEAVGRNAGIPRRMVELAAPFTNSKEHGQAIERLTRDAWGHVGPAILEHYSLDLVLPLIAHSHSMLGGEYGSAHEDAMAEHLAAHLAGAQMLDELLGTGGVVFNSALVAAAGFLDECAPPPSDADRILEEIAEWIAREPGAWPTREQYDALMRPKSFDSDQVLPVHAFKTEYAGYRESNKVFVTKDAWKRMVDELDVESKVALRDLWDRNLLEVQPSRRRRGEWLSQNRVMGCSVYEIVLPDPDEDEPSTPENVGPTAPVGGPVGDSDPTVGGAVGGANMPLTCGVGGVGGVGGEISRANVHAREIHFPDPEPKPENRPEPVAEAPAEPIAEAAHEVLAKLDQPVPCTVCGEPTGYSLNGVAMHAGDCAAAPTAPTHPAPAAPPSTVEPRRGTDRREARFTAPAAVLDGEGIHLADGSVRPFPPVAHIGDLAALTGRDQLRLGWGGGEDRLPDQGQVWLFAAALERLGLPATQPSLPDKALTKAQRAKETSKIFSRLDEHPMVAGALEAGWQLGQGGHLDVWTRIWHPELLPQGALLVGLPWHRIEGVALFEDDPTPGELARRLLLFAQRVGVAYRITSAATGLDLIDHHRPPRRDAFDDRGQSRNRVALVRNTAAEIPPWRAKTTDARFTGLEQDFSWWRPWEKLSGAEQDLRYVHGYDRNASYLVPWRSIELGVENLIHRTGDEAAWDGKEKPGYYLVDAGWEWENWGLPDPGEAAGARVGNNRVWVTVHTLKQLKAHGITPRVHESYTWGLTARYLEGPGTMLGEARAALTPVAADDPGAAAVLATVKALYSATVGKLAEREHRGDFHLWRPDWRDMIIGATKTAILHTVTKAQERSGASPLVVDRDAVFYASNDPDPITAWPGDPAKLGAGLGSWKPIGSTELGAWGPVFLPKRTGRWHYADAVEALRGEGHE